VDPKKEEEENGGFQLEGAESTYSRKYIYIYFFFLLCTHTHTYIHTHTHTRARARVTAVRGRRKGKACMEYLLGLGVRDERGEPK